ncbi:MAG: hypothetical protein U5R14_13105 [Gemmatimonadota bacterium]|nr:hypothetical protein [Gemmatimonadota bacterium]
MSESTEPGASTESWGTATDPHAADTGLRGRTYAIPFDRVWKAARGLADGGLRRWSLVRDDDREGTLEARSRTWPLGRVDEVMVSVGLDENGQTRVDLRCRRIGDQVVQRRHPRLVRTFFARLDRALGATAADVLDPTRPPPWAEEAPR